MQVRIPEDHAKPLRVLAALNNRTVPGEVEEAIKSHLMRNRAALKSQPMLDTLSNSASKRTLRGKR